MEEFHFVMPATRFKCKRCASCCSLDVMLSNNEIAQLGESCNVEWRTTKKVSRGSEITCCLLQGKSCSIYETRPKLCRIYPFFAIPESELSMFNITVDVSALRFSGDDRASYVVIYDEKCPGIGEGSSSDWQSVVALTISHKKDFQTPDRNKLNASNSQ